MDPARARESTEARPGAVCRVVLLGFSDAVPCDTARPALPGRHLSGGACIGPPICLQSLRRCQCMRMAACMYVACSAAHPVRSGHVHYVLLWVCSHRACMWCNPSASYRGCLHMCGPSPVRTVRRGVPCRTALAVRQCTLCPFAACVGVAAGSQPAATLLCHVCCVAHAHVPQPPQPTRHAVVCGLHIVSMASRAELCIKRHSTKKQKKNFLISNVYQTK